jgi:hypothetical protein
MMARDFSSSRFLSSEFDSEPDVDPRVGLVNLADVMLVFACGLMLALVAYWNLDISEMREVVQANEVTEVQDVEDIEEGARNGGGFIELGKVYQDPMTGKYYMLQEDVDKGDGSGGAGENAEGSDSSGSGGDGGETNNSADANNANDNPGGGSEDDTADGDSANDGG